MANQNQTFSSRFDIVCKAFTQTGGKKLIMDRDMINESWFREDFTFFSQTGVYTERLAEAATQMHDRRTEIESVPLIKFGKVKLFDENGSMTIDGQIYDFLSRSPQHDHNCFRFSKEAIDLINNVKLDQESLDFIEDIRSERFDVDLKLGFDAAPVDPEHPDRILYGIFDAEENYFARNLKAFMMYRISTRDGNTSIFTELCGGSENNPSSAMTCGMYDFLPGDTDSEKNVAAVTFALKFFVIYNATKSPLTLVSCSKEKQGNRSGNGNYSDSGSARHYYVTLSKDFRERRKAAVSYGVRDKTGLELIPTQVSGYIRTQHYGPGNRETRLIWVDGFVRGQWNTKAPRNVSVRTGSDSVTEVPDPSSLNAN